MNYIKIYEDFISSRRAKIFTKDQLKYSEIHHIKPISAFPIDYVRDGAADRANISNKIRLSYADHLFAHILLAKIYGGKGWITLSLMLGVTKRRLGLSEWIGGRQRYDALRSLVYAHLDKSNYTFVNKAGDTFSGTIYQFRDHTGLDLHSIRDVSNGRQKSIKGWRLSTTDEHAVGSRKGERHSMFNSQVREFLHLDGRAFSGTQLAFHQAHGLRRQDVSKIVVGTRRMSQGWRLASTPLTDVIGAGKAKRNFNYDPTLYSFIHNDGRNEVCTMYDLRVRHNLTTSGLSNMMSRKSKSVSGWHLA